MNTAILTCARKHEGAVRAVLVRALAERKPEGAIPVFLKYAEDENGKVRQAAFKALETYAGQDELPNLLNMLKSNENEGDQEGLERAILAVCKRIESGEEQTRLLLAALPQADDSTRASLILIIGNLPSEKTLEAVLEAVNDENELHSLWVLTGLISPFYDLLEELTTWTVERGVERNTASQYIADMFQSLSFAFRTKIGQL